MPKNGCTIEINFGHIFENVTNSGLVLWVRVRFRVRSWDVFWPWFWQENPIFFENEGNFFSKFMAFCCAAGCAVWLSWLAEWGKEGEGGKRRKKEKKGGGRRKKKEEGARSRKDGKQGDRRRKEKGRERRGKEEGGRSLV